MQKTPLSESAVSPFSGTESQSLADLPHTPQRRRHPWWRRLLKAVLIVIASIVGLFLLLGGVVWLILTPPRLTPIVNRIATKYLNATVHFDTVRLSLFENFPHVSLQLKNGEVISGVFAAVPDSLRGVIPVRADSLLRFGEFSVTLNLPRLAAGQIAIRQLKLVDPEIYAYVSPAGNANWNIYTPSDTTVTDTTAMDLTTLFGIRVRELVLERGHITYDSRPDRLYATLDPIDLKLRGHRNQRYEIDFGSDVSMQQKSVAYCAGLPLALKGGFAFDTKHPGAVALDKLTFKIADIPVMFDGTAVVAGDSIVSDMSCRVHPLLFKQALALVPAELMPTLQRIETNLSADLDTRVKGTYRFNGSVLPSVKLDFKVNGGYLGYQGSRARIDNLALDASLYYHPLRSDSTGMVLHKLAVDGIGMKFRADDSVWDVQRDARVKGKMHGSINLGTLAELFSSKQKGIITRGIIGIDADVSCRMSQLTPRKIGQTRIHAALTLNNLLVDMPQDTLRILADKSIIRLGANPNRPEHDTLIAAGTQVIYLEVQADTMQINLKDEMEVTVAGAHMKMRNAASMFGGDTTVVHPFTGSAETRYLELNGLDSTWVKAEEASTSFSILPSAVNPQIPLIRLRIGSMGLTARSQENLYVLNGSDVAIEATLSTTRREQAQKLEHRLDSLQRIYPTIPRDSLVAHNRAIRLKAREGKRVKDDFAAEDIDIQVDRSIGNLLRRWNAKGTISAINGRVVTPYFPVNTSLKNVDVSFTTDKLELRGTEIHAGVSQLNLTGEVANIRRALLGRGALRVDMNIESDTLDVNELVKAANAGAAYAQSSEAYKDSLKQASSEEHLQQMIDQKTQADSSAQSSLIVIPANVEMDIDLDVHYGVYADLILNKLSGCLIVRDRCLQLNDLTAVTDAGELTLTALYATRSRTDLTTGFDLEMKKMQVAKLINLIPSVDTLLPMLRSFEGVVDCQIAATAALDTSMNILLPTLDAACRIHGENLVLLDGETFTEISKMLHFKNKKRNVIDKMSVEMLVRDNQIEMFPFVIEMDRYRAAISGVQKLDMSFNYHISVLKSPIPFRLGVDIFGNPDKFKFRIGRARYKSADVPSYVELIDSTRLNLRRQITDIFRRGVDAAKLSELTITPAVSLPSEATGSTESLTAADTLLLRQQGVLSDSTAHATDSTTLGNAVTIPDAEKVTAGAVAEKVSAADKRRSSRKRVKASAEAVLPEEER